MSTAANYNSREITKLIGPIVLHCAIAARDCNYCRPIGGSEASVQIRQSTENENGGK